MVRVVEIRNTTGGRVVTEATKLRVSPLAKKANARLAKAHAQARTNAFLLTLAVMKVPGAPVAEYRFHPTRKWRFDYAWPERLLALEVDGGVWTRGKHGRGAGIVKDHEKQNAAVALGWRVMRCTPADLTDPALAKLIADAYHWPP